MVDLKKPEIKSIDPFDTRNFNSLFEELYTPLCQYCMKLVNDIDVAEDIVQEQFVYLWENWNRLAPNYSIKPYLYKAVKNKSLNHLKKEFNKNKVLRFNEFYEIPHENSLASTNDLLENNELEALLEKALENLPLRCRTVFKMKRFAELSNKEIAGNLNISIKTVEAQMTIAIKKLSAFVSIHWCVFFLFLLN